MRQQADGKQTASNDLQNELITINEKLQGSNERFYLPDNACRRNSISAPTILPLAVSVRPGASAAKQKKGRRPMTEGSQARTQTHVSKDES